MKELENHYFIEHLLCASHHSISFIDGSSFTSQNTLELPPVTYPNFIDEKVK